MKTMYPNPDVVVHNYPDTFFCARAQNDMPCEDMVAGHMLTNICSGEMKYLEVRLKNISHFPAAFKEEFGIPSVTDTLLP